jgi:hypothetical protein
MAPRGCQGIVVEAQIGKLRQHFFQRVVCQFEMVSGARAGWSLTNHVDSKATTPALRATPPVPGGEFSFGKFQSDPLPANAKALHIPQYHHCVIARSTGVGDFDSRRRKEVISNHSASPSIGFL